MQTQVVHKSHGDAFPVTTKICHKQVITQTEEDMIEKNIGELQGVLNFDNTNLMEDNPNLYFKNQVLSPDIARMKLENLNLINLQAKR